MMVIKPQHQATHTSHRYRWATLVTALLLPHRYLPRLGLLQIHTGDEHLIGFMVLHLFEIHRCTKAFMTIKAHHHVAVFVDLHIVHRTSDVSGGFMGGECNRRLLVFL